MREFLGSAAAFLLGPFFGPPVQLDLLESLDSSGTFCALITSPAEFLLDDKERRRFVKIVDDRSHVWAETREGHAGLCVGARQSLFPEEGPAYRGVLQRRGGGR